MSLSPITIRLDGLSVYAHHGVDSEEQERGQHFEFDVELDLADCAACRTDDVADAVAYEAVVAVVVAVATGFRFKLMESLAEAVCAELLTEFSASRVRLSISKAAPRITHALTRAQITIERTVS